MQKEAKEALNRYALILELLVNKKDETGLELLKALVTNCSVYVRYVATYEGRIAHYKRRYDGKILTDEIERLDIQRTRYHNAIIRSLYILNRYLFKIYSSDIPIGGIFTLGPNHIKNENSANMDDRYYIALWAGYLIEALSRKK